MHLLSTNNEVLMLPVCVQVHVCVGGMCICEVLPVYICT